MIYLLLTKDTQNDLQNNIIKHLKKYFVNIKYKIIYCDQHIIEKNLSAITDNDYVLFHPIVAANNLWLVKKYLNSVVILQNKTVLIQKISKRNSINENMAINNGFKLMYIEPNYDDITNDDWKLVIQPEDYVVSIEHIIENQSIINT